MELPRWTAWPALALLFAMALVAVPRPVKDASEAELALAAGRKTTFPRVAVLGIDGLDPDLLAEAIERFPDRSVNFARLAQENGLHALGTSTPPQSPVAWSNFITGMGPGGHGVFDFIHRHPMLRTPIPGSVRIEASHPFQLWSDWQFPRGGDSESNRSGKAFWTLLAEHGVPADIWRMPANFRSSPARGCRSPG